jgi:arginine-tRNA-protein transferase
MASVGYPGFKQGPDYCFPDLERTAPEEFRRLGYGSFHQKYYLDDKLVAVGVIDILPNCLVSLAQL